MANDINGCADVEARMAEQLPVEISVVWCIEDVLEVDSSLSDEQARLVLQWLKDGHDASVGINWEVIEDMIDTLRHEGDL